jgi:hypothetical protein
MATPERDNRTNGGEDAGQRTSRNMVWAWIAGFIILGIAIWITARIAAGIQPDYRASGINAGAGGIRQTTPPPGLPTPAGTGLPHAPPPRTISSDSTYHYHPTTPKTP